MKHYPISFKLEIMDIPIILTNNFLKHEFANLDYQPKEE
jgi:hypothetical protein